MPEAVFEEFDADGFQDIVRESDAEEEEGFMVGYTSAFHVEKSGFVELAGAHTVGTVYVVGIYLKLWAAESSCFGREAEVTVNLFCLCLFCTWRNEDMAVENGEGVPPKNVLD
jgi:hypothetical protein